MKSAPTNSKDLVVKNLYFSNWGDNLGYPLAFAVLPYVAKIPGVTPNLVTILSFFLYLTGCLLLFINVPHHLSIAGIFIILGFVGDDLDGQLARYKKMHSDIGSFLDLTLDVLKIFIISLSLGYAVYLQSQQIIHLFMGFASCFFFFFRYYIKLETIFAQILKDEKYLEKSLSKRAKLISQMNNGILKHSTSFIQSVRKFVFQHKLIFVLDEAEFAILIGVFAFLNRLDIALYIFAFGQFVWAIYRWVERGYQIHTNSPRLLWPMRK